MDDGYDALLRRFGTLKTTTTGATHSTLGVEAIAQIKTWVSTASGLTTKDARVAGLEKERTALESTTTIISQVDDFLTRGQDLVGQAQGSGDLTSLLDTFTVVVMKLEVAIRNLEAQITAFGLFNGLIGILNPLLDALLKLQRQIELRAEQSQQQATILADLDSDLAELTTALEMLPPLSNGETWALSAERARQGVVAWLEQHRKLTTAHTRQAWVAAWLPLLEKGISRAPGLQKVVEQLESYRRDWATIEGSPDQGSITIFITTITTFIQRITTARVDIEAIHTQAKKPAIVKGLIKKLDDLKTDSEALKTKAENIDVPVDDGGEEDIQRNPLEQLTRVEQISVTKRIWSWYRKILQTTVPREPMLQPRLNELNNNSLNLNRDLATLLEWAKHPDLVKVQSVDSVNKMIELEVKAKLKMRKDYKG